MADSVRVVCRFRPQNSIETSHGGKVCIDVEGDDKSVNLEMNGGDTRHAFTFDKVFGMAASQQEVYAYSVGHIVDDVLGGYNGTVFAYGQTSAGKTHTMMGSDIDDDRMRGIIPRMVDRLFEAFDEADADTEFTVKVSYMEIYNERIRDLLDPAKANLKIKEDKARGIFVDDVTEEYVADPNEVYELMRVGAENKAMASTNMNLASSRSHSIFQVTVTQRNLKDMRTLNGKLFLVDLAGSEKIKKTGAAGQQLEEAKNINQSLSALGNVINALTDGKSTHVPYRDSKLTRMLQESLGGNSKTTLVINCSPSSYNDLETLSTLRFGMRAKRIQNRARVNAERSAAELKALLAKAELKIEQQAAVIQRLETENRILREDASPETLAKVSDAVSRPKGKASATGDDDDDDDDDARDDLLVKPVTSQDAMALQVRLAELEEERDELLATQDALVEQLQDKEEELALLGADGTGGASSSQAAVDEMEQQLVSLNKQNELLIQKLADLRFEHDKMSYDANDKDATIESLTAARDDLRDQLEQLRGEHDRLLQQANADALAAVEKSDEAEVGTADGAAAAAAADGEPLADLDAGSGDEARQDGVDARVTELEDLVAQLKEQNSSLEERLKEARPAEDASDVAPTADTSGTSLPATTPDGLANVEALYREQVAELEAELASVREQLAKAGGPPSGGEQGASGDAAASPEDRAAVEADLKQLKAQAAQQLTQFERLKEALLRDLQDRCDKIVELETALDDMRDMYTKLYNQSNTKALKKQNVFLERNLQQLTNAHLKVVNENSAKKTECDLAEKKLAFRNDRISYMERMLQEANERIQKMSQQHEADMAKLRELEAAGADRGTGASGASGAAAGKRSHIVKPIVNRRHGQGAKRIVGGGGAGGNATPVKTIGGGGRRSPSTSPSAAVLSPPAGDPHGPGRKSGLGKRLMNIFSSKSSAAGARPAQSSAHDPTSTKAVPADASGDANAGPFTPAATLTRDHVHAAEAEERKQRERERARAAYDDPPAEPDAPAAAAAGDGAE